MDTPIIISSPELPAGPKPSTLPAGIETDLFGQPLSPASPFPSPASSEGRQMTATSGLHSSGSSASIALSASLVSKLHKRLDSIGSMEYRLIWKRKATRSGRTYWELVPSARPIGDSGSTGWRSPDSNNRGGAITDPAKVLSRMKAGRVAALAGWVSSTAQDGRRGDKPLRPQDTGVPLSQQVVMVGWATPDANAMNDGEGLETWDARQAKNKAKHGNGNGAGMPLAMQVQIAGWGTPRVTTNGGNGNPERATDGQARLEDQVHGAMTHAELVAAGLRVMSEDGERWVDSGTTSPASPAGTENLEGSSAEPSLLSRGALNPAHSRWLQGFPVAWCQAAIRASRKLKPARKRG